MTFTTPEELSYDRAYNAHRMTSFVPEKRARQEQEGYANHLNGLYEKMQALVKEPQQQAVFEAEMSRYKDGYSKRVLAHLDASSRCASTMITGPAKFPTARNQKRLDIAHRRLCELLDWCERAESAIAKNINNALLVETQIEEDFQRWKRDILSSIHTVRDIDNGVNTWSHRPLFVSSATEKIIRLASNGRIKLAQDLLRAIQEEQATYKKPAITTRHKVWKILDLKQEVYDAKQPTGEEELFSFEGGRVVKNYSENRLQILFDSIPPKEMRTKLKSAAWKWSPRNSAWQRQLTSNAIDSAKAITSIG